MANPARGRKRLMAVALGLAAAVVGVLLAGHGQPGEARVAVSPSPAASPVQRTVPVLQTEAPDRSPAQAQAIETWKTMLSDYKALAEYPPSSWPLEPGRDDLLHWKQMLTSPSQVFDDRAGEQTTVRFASDMYDVMYGETMTATLEIVRSSGGSEERLPFTIHSAWVIGQSARPGRLMPIVLRDDGTAGDLRANDQLYTVRLRPVDHDELTDEGEFVLHAEVECAGVRKGVELAFTAATHRVLEVRSVSDELRDGSLVVKLDADVHEAGTYVVLANVVAADGKLPIAHHNRNFVLEPGRQTIELVFFGRIFAGLDVDGPYLVRDIHGARLPTAEREAHVWWQVASPHTTQPYHRGQFSPAEWDSPEKQQKLQAFEDMIRDLETGKVQVAEGAAPLNIIPGR